MKHLKIEGVSEDFILSQWQKETECQSVITETLRLQVLEGLRTKVNAPVHQPICELR